VPSNHNYVCFECRVAVRTEKAVSTLPRCPHCGWECRDIGHDIALPPTEDVDAWERLYVGLRETERRSVQVGEEARVARIYELGRQIEYLEHLPENPRSARTLRELRQQLAHARRHSGFARRISARGT